MPKPGVDQNIALHAVPTHRTSLKLPFFSVGAQGYQRCPVFKPGVGQNIALHAVPADRTSFKLFFFPLPNFSHYKQ